jgi:dihydroneopterin aldolase
LEHEKASGQTFLIDLGLEVDLAPAGTSDELGQTVDYGAVAQRVHDVAAGERWDLIERLAQRIAETVLEHELVDRVTVTVHKPGAPIEVPFGDVTVTIVRTR